MANDISGFGLRVLIKASVTFPAGIVITQFPDDADPLDSPSIQVKDAAMGPNGDLIVWSKANPNRVTINVIPNSENDRDLQVLLNANRAQRGALPANDVITMTMLYPDGSQATGSNGSITDGMQMNSLASAGRLKTKPYAFVFETTTGGNA